MGKKCALGLGLALIGACSSETVVVSNPAPPVEEPAPWQAPAVIGSPALEDINPDPNVVESYLTIRATEVELKDGTKTTMIGYDGLFPGPMIKAKIGDRVIVHFKNNLTEPTTIHWHGLRISDQMDGSPRVQSPIPAGGTFDYDFVVKEAGSYWYHPHVRANQQVESGLYGPLVVFDPNDPAFDNERYMVLDDILLDDAGRLSPPSMAGMTAMHGRTGNMLLTNGRPAKSAAGTAEEGKVERWRIVNTANARTMVIGVDGAKFRVIGTDGGLLPTPYTAERLELPVGQRYDLEVTYDRPGTARLISYVPTLNAQDEVVLSPFDAYRVDVAATGNAPRIVEYPSRAPLETLVPTRAESIAIDAVQTDSGEVAWRLNGKSHSMDPLFTFAQGETVKIRLENKLGPEHPFHLHGQFFQILDPKLPGLKDTVLVPGMSSVEIVAKMDNPGHWMAHCHILEHAELGMMSEIYVTPAAGGAASAPAPMPAH